MCVCKATSCYSLLFGKLKLCTFACFDHRQLANTAGISMQFSSKTFWAFFFFFFNLYLVMFLTSLYLRPFLLPDSVPRCFLKSPTC